MKKLPALVLVIALFATSAFTADKPADILKDYQERSAPVLEKLNDTLLKQWSPVVAQLIRDGDNAGAETVTEQVKQKSAGAPVARPHAAIAPLFAQYDAALLKALQPLQRSAYTRIDAAVKSAGTDVAAVGELVKVRQAIEAGIVTAPPSNERYFVGKSWFSQAGSEYHFNKDGTGYRFQKMDFADKVALTWQQHPDGIVEVTQRKQPAAQPSQAYFKFVDSKTAFLGDTRNNIASSLTLKR